MAQFEDLLFEMELNTENMTSGLARIEAALRQTDRASGRTTTNMRSGFLATSYVVSSLRSALAGLVAAMSVRELLRFSDTFTQVQNSLRVAGIATENLTAITNELFDVANRTRQPIDAMAQLFQRASLQTRELGITTSDLIGFMETVGQAVAVSGTSFEAARGALIQLGQALGSSNVRAEEFNSIQEGAPAILRAAAIGIDEAGGSVSRLRTLVINGQITNREFYEGIQEGAAFIRDAFGRTNLTIAQAFTVLTNSMVQFVGRTDEASGGSRALATAILDLATALRSPEFQNFAEVTVEEIRKGVEGLKVAFRELAPVVADTFASMQSDGEAFLELLDEVADAVRENTAEGFAAQLAEGDPAEALERVNARLVTAYERRNQLIEDGYTEATSIALRKQNEFIAALEAEQGKILGAMASLRLQPIAEPRQDVTPDLRTLRGQIARNEALEGTGGGTTPPATGDASKFTKQLADLERQAELLRDIGLTRSEISDIMSAEGDLERRISDGERDRLQLLTQTVAVLEQRRDLGDEAGQLLLQIDAQGQVTEQLRVQTRLLELKAEYGELVARALEGEVTEVEQLRTALQEAEEARNLQETLEDMQLETRFAGQQTEEYRIQARALALKRQLTKELTADQQQLVEQIEREVSARNAAAAKLRLSQEGRDAQLGLRYAGQNALSDEILGISSQEFRVQQRLQGFRDQGIPEDQIAGLEAQARQVEALNTQLAITENVLPDIAGGLASLGETAIFEGLDAAAQQFLQTMIRLALQLAAMQIVFGVASAFGPGAGAGAGTPAAAGAGGGPTYLFPPTVIPRQHGGPVGAGGAYLVGEAGPELFVPNQGGRIVPHGGATGGVTIVDQRGPQAPPIETTTDFNGMVTARIRSEVGGMMREGSLQRGMGVRRPGVARG